MNILLIIHNSSKFKIPAVTMVIISKIKKFPSMYSFNTYDFGKLMLSACEFFFSKNWKLL